MSTLPSNPQTGAQDDGPRAPVAVVTGASSGMGYATAELLLHEGWTVVGLDRVGLDRVGNGLPGGAGDLTRVQVDITDRAAVRAALEESLPAGRPLDLVANVAGVYPPSTLDSFSEDLYRRTFDVNVLGLLNVTAEAAGRLGPGSAVVNFSSVDAFTVSPGQLLYGASKAAVVMLTKQLALELAPAGSGSTRSHRAGSTPRGTRPPAGWSPRPRPSRSGGSRNRARSPAGSSFSPVPRQVS